MLSIPRFDQFIQAFSNAVSLSSIYALIAIGYTMVYGILRLINFAHGDMMMMTMYFAFYSASLFFAPWYVAFLIAIVGVVLLGISVERIVYRPIRSAPRASLLISAIGTSYLLQNLATVVFSGIPKTFPVVPLFQDVLTIGTVKLQRLTIIVPLLTVVIVIGLLNLVHKTKTGMGMRAISVDVSTSKLMGINVNKIISATFAIGSALAAIGALFWMLKFPKMDPYVGVIPGFKCFIAAVLGGIGNIKGAVLGATVLAFIEIMIIIFFPTLINFKDAFAFIILILMLLFKPSGLLGETGTTEKA